MADRNTKPAMTMIEFLDSGAEFVICVHLGDFSEMPMSSGMESNLPKKR